MKALTAIVTALLLAGCGSSGSTATGDPVKCEAKMRTMIEARVAEALAGQSPSPTSTKPTECDGLTDEELAEIGTRILAGEPTPTPS